MLSRVGPWKAGLRSLWNTLGIELGAATEAWSAGLSFVGLVAKVKFFLGGKIWELKKQGLRDSLLLLY